MHARTLIAFTALAPLASAQAAPALKVTGLVQVWGNLILDGSLRTGTAARYTSIRSDWRENGFALRRAELKVAGQIAPDVEAEAMFDPSLSTGAVLQDAALTLKLGHGFSLRTGQYKTFQTLDGAAPTAELVFADRSQIGRLFGDIRERGASVHFAGNRLKASLGVFNGEPKANDNNAQKDVAFRVEFRPAAAHLLGAYGLAGSTNLKDTGGQKALTFAGPAGTVPSGAAVLEDKDGFGQVGAFYQFQSGPWTLELDVLSGRWGRRAPSLGTAAGAAQREHLDQRFLGSVALGSYRQGRHTFAVRLDRFDANAGTRYYGPASPYVVAGKDQPPVFGEYTLGYAYALTAQGFRAANLKLNYLHRRGPWLLLGGPSVAQGGNLLAALQVAF